MLERVADSPAARAKEMKDGCETDGPSAVWQRAAEGLPSSLIVARVISNLPPTTAIRSC